MHPEKHRDKIAHGASIIEVAFSCDLLAFTRPSSPPPHHAVAAKREGGSYRNRAAQRQIPIPSLIQNSSSKIQKSKPLTPAFRPLDRLKQPFVEMLVYVS